MNDTPTPTGLHHVTAICGDPRENRRFYSELLGLRLVKKTVNFDDPGTYHLYYGDRVGSPGTLLTFFAWTSPPPMTFARGRAGAGQISEAILRAPSAACEWWMSRFAAAAIDFDLPDAIFGARSITARDPDGMGVRIVFEDGPDSAAFWPEGPVPVEHAIRAVQGVAILTHDPAPTAELLTGPLGFRAAGEETGTHRYVLGTADEGGAWVDLVVDPEVGPGRMGIGAIHHVAWRAPGKDDELAQRKSLGARGYTVTPVRDRNYFESIYFNEPGGVVFEIATDAPGFTVDETEAELGRQLRLPPWLEPRRERIEARLPAF